jgi:uncharacterized protein (DUF697 family)
MPALQPSSLWNILRQVNIGEIHAEAERAIEIVVAGPPGSPAKDLAEILQSDEVITDAHPASAVRTTGPPLDDQAVAGADLLIAVNMDPQTLASVQDHVPVILVNTGVAQPSSHPAIQQAPLTVIDREHVEDVLAPAVAKQLGDGALAAARRLPILRQAYGDWLLNETSRANAIYAFSTGIAETVPVLNIPLNMADIVVLTKNQLIMVYKLALAAGRATSPVAVIGELVGVIGAGFLWRQIARELIGLIPAVGIVPKVAVAYAGTYAVGQAAQTYLVEGQVPGSEQLKSLYTEAIERGRTLAQSLARRNERPEGAEGGPAS